MRLHHIQKNACACKFASARQLPEVCVHPKLFRAHAMSDQDSQSNASPASDEGHGPIHLTTIVFEAPDDLKALERLPAKQRAELVWLDKTLEPIIATQIGGQSAAKQQSRYILQAKKYLVKYQPYITISEAAAHPVMFGIVLFLCRILADQLEFTELLKCTTPGCESKPVAACAKKFHCETHKAQHTILVAKEAKRAEKAALTPNTPPPRACAGMGPNRPHFTLSLAEAMDNRSEKAVVGNAVRFAKAIPNLVRTNTNALSSPQIITTPKSVNITKTIHG